MTFIYRYALPIWLLSAVLLAAAAALGRSWLFMVACLTSLLVAGLLYAARRVS